MSLSPPSGSSPPPPSFPPLVGANSPHLDLLEALGRATPKEATDPPRNRRVFVNRTVRMDQIDVIGFDMDYTLALYHQPRMESLSATCTLRKMVEQRGYPSEILNLPYDGQMAIRGLVIDKKNGNLLKMDRYGFVGRGAHGTTPLSRQDRARLYRAQQLRLSTARYAWIDTLFAIPEAVLYAQVVDFFDRDPAFLASSAEARAARYTQLWTDIRECIDEAHHDDSIKRVIVENLGEYIVQDPELASTLNRFRSAGKRLFLLTNSGFTYTDTVMTYLLDGKLPNHASWRSYFDAVIVDAHKPSFFVESAPLLALGEDGTVLGAVPEASEPAASRNTGAVSTAAFYQGGNVRTLSEVLSLPEDRVLYIGDHIYGDMLRAKRSSVWRTAMVVQELESELSTQARVEEPLQQLETLDRRRLRLDAELRYQQLLLHQLDELSAGGALATPLLGESASREVLDEARGELRRRIDELSESVKKAFGEVEKLEVDIEHTFNPFWGPLLKAGTENSRLGEQVEDYACLYTSRVSNFLAYSPLQYFRSPRDHLPHERVY